MSVIVPVYRNAEGIASLIERLDSLNREMDGSLEAVIVVDGSPDRSLDLLGELLPGARFEAQVLTLSRNFGSFAAIKAGLARAAGPLFAVMAADLQEPPELILAFWRELREGRVDVVVGRRDGRADPFAARIVAQLFWTIYRACIQAEVPPGGVDVFACNAAFRDQLLALEERNTTLVGLIFWLGFRRDEVRYRRLPRAHGESAWSLRRKAEYLLDSAFAFSRLPIRLMEFAGLLGLLLACLLGTMVFVAKLRGEIPIPGYAATVIVVIFFGALNALGIGLLGEYMWRAFENTKARPPFVIAREWRYAGRVED